jgi:subfamily B ATP-binding cassette protein MsbA
LSSSAFLQWVNYQVGAFIVLHGTQQALVYFCGFIVVIFTLKNLARYFTLYFLAPIRTGVVRDLREAMHARILALHLGYFSNERRGDLISRTSADVNEVETSIISSLEIVFRDPLLIIAYLGTMFFMSWKLTLFVLVLLPGSGVFISIIGRKLKGASKKGQGKLGEVMSAFDESLSGLRIIQAFNAQDLVHGRFREINNAYQRLMVRLFRKQYLGSPLTEILSAITLAILVYYGGMLVLQEQEGGFTGEFFITFIVIFSQLIAPAKSFSEAYFKIQKGIASVERINEVVQAEVRIQSAPDALPVSTFGESLHFEGVGFAYGSNRVLSDIHLTIRKGSRVALVGPSGGGKSTLANLVPRFYDVTEGRITLDGTDLRRLNLKDLRNLFGIVSQESILFNDSVANNIRLSRPQATDDEVEQAARIANAWEFIAALPKGMHTHVGDGGNKLSGGQKQRISIARAVLKNPAFLILDEATSALDTESERLVQDALNRLMEGRTSLVIAHRLSTIQHADVIVVLEAGRITEMGTHDELLEKGGTYRKLYDLQSFR